MRELRNYGDEVAREITSRGGVEGSLSQEHFFEDLMKLVRITVIYKNFAPLWHIVVDSAHYYSLPHLDDFYEHVTPSPHPAGRPVQR